MTLGIRWSRETKAILERSKRMTRDELTDHEIGLLKLLHLYAAPLDMRSSRFSAVVKAAARECVRKGLVSGFPKVSELTEAGLKAVEK